MRDKTLLALLTYAVKDLNPRALADAEAATDDVRVLWRDETGAGIAYRTGMRACDLFDVLVGDGRRGFKRVRVFEIAGSWFMPGETVNHAWLERHVGAPADFD